MKYFDWDSLKSEKLQKERGVNFEEVLVALEEDRLLATIENPNQAALYPGQKMLVIEIQEYAYLVPFAEDDEKVFLKTIIPSRKKLTSFEG